MQSNASMLISGLTVDSDMTWESLDATVKKLFEVCAYSGSYVSFFYFCLKLDVAQGYFFNIIALNDVPLLNAPKQIPYKSAHRNKYKIQSGKPGHSP